MVKNMSTTIVNSQDVQREWFVIDAEGQTIGRLATRIATVLRGKHKVTFTPHVDGGDYVIVLNADKIVFTGKKLDQKKYYKYSGYMGGLRSWTARELMNTYPERIVESAVKGMLPKNRLARQMIKKLKIYSGSEHAHSAQNPQPFPKHV
jgi:large subunit ribosomal protein L13